MHSAGRGLLKFDGVPISSSVAVGDTVLTSGLGGFFPQGITIGYVIMVEPDANGWLWQVTVKPSVEYGQLEEIFVVSGIKNDK